MKIFMSFCVTLITFENKTLRGKKSTIYLQWQRIFFRVNYIVDLPPTIKKHDSLSKFDIH